MLETRLSSRSTHDRCVLAAQCEAGLTRKMIPYPVPRSKDLALRRKIAKTMRYYRRFYRPQNEYR